MLKCNEVDVLRIFEAVHGRSIRCSYEVIYDDRGDVLGVAVMKDGLECWRATIAELALDYTLLLADCRGAPADGA